MTSIKSTLEASSRAAAWRLDVASHMVLKMCIADNDTSDINPSDLPQEIFEIIRFKKSGLKPQKGRKKRPSDEELIRLKKEGWTQDQVAEKYAVWRETVTRWYAVIKKKDKQ